MSSRSKDQKHPQYGHLPLSTSGPQECALTGNELLRSPYFNKGSAFTAEERHTFKLHSLLPPNVQTLNEQVKRAYQQYSSRSDDLAKNTFMTSMKEQNEVLYYRLIQDHLEEMFPVIYTPTEGEAIANFSRLFRRPEGCFLNIDDKDRIDDNISQWGKPDDIDLIVVSDGEQILGIGDQGVGGILISIAKLVIYTLCAGIHPTRTLPVVLDCGTNNTAFLADELYLGLRKPRVRGKEYDEFIDTFIQTARKRYPKAYIHFEDFGLQNARRILERYTPSIPCFNDDIQGTGIITLAALTSALHITQTPWSALRVICFGAGTAGTGIADMISDSIAFETSKPTSSARQQIWCVDKTGLLLESARDDLTAAQAPYARRDAEWEGKEYGDLLAVVREVRPHVLIGTSTQKGAFTREVVEEMAKHVARPIIFPLSNPTSLHEALPADLLAWTKGKALVATGSPFAPVTYDGVAYEVAECNNSVCFPGIGLGAVLSRTKLMTPPLLVAATKAIAAAAPALRDPKAGLVPGVKEVREVSVKIAAAVIRASIEEGLNEEKAIPAADGDLEEWIREQMWTPEYRPLHLVGEAGASAHAKGEVGSSGARGGTY